MLLDLTVRDPDEVDDADAQLLLENLKPLLTGEPPNYGVNLPVRPVTALANCASAAPARPAGYAGRWPATE